MLDEFYRAEAGERSLVADLGDGIGRIEPGGTDRVVLGLSTVMGDDGECGGAERRLSVVDRTLCGGDHLGVVSRRAEKAYECGPEFERAVVVGARLETDRGEGWTGEFADGAGEDVGGGALDEAVETVQSGREGLPHVEVVLAGKRSGEA